MFRIWCSHETAAEDAAQRLFCHRRRDDAGSPRRPQCTVCRQCTTNVRGGRCLSQFQICVCVSGLVLSVSKFSLCQSASAVTKSLRHCAVQYVQVFSPLKKKRKAVC